MNKINQVGFQNRQLTNNFGNDKKKKLSKETPQETVTSNVPKKGFYVTLGAIVGLAIGFIFRKGKPAPKAPAETEKVLKNIKKETIETPRKMVEDYIKKLLNKNSKAGDTVRKAKIETTNVKKIAMSAENRAINAEKNAARATEHATQAENRASNLEKALSDTEKRAMEAEQSSANAHNRATKAEKHASNLEKALSDTEKRALEAEKNSANAHNRATKAENRANNLEKVLSDTEKRALEAEQSSVNASNRATKAENRASNLEKALSDTEKRALEAEQNSVEAYNRATHAENRANNLEKALSDIEKRALQAEQNSVKAYDRATKAENRASSLEKALSDTEKRAMEAEQNSANAYNRATKAENRASNLEKVLSDTEKRALEAEQNSVKAYDRATKAESRVASLEKALNAKENHVVNLEKALNATETRAITAEKNIIKANNVAASLEKNLSKTEIFANTLKKALNETEARAIAAEKNAANANLRASQAEIRSEKAEKQFTALKTKMQGNKAIIKNAMNHLDKAQQQINDTSIISNLLGYIAKNNVAESQKMVNANALATAKLMTPPPVPKEALEANSAKTISKAKTIIKKIKKQHETDVYSIHSKYMVDAIGNDAIPLSNIIGYKREVKGLNKETFEIFVRESKGPKSTAEYFFGKDKGALKVDYDTFPYEKISFVETVNHLHLICLDSKALGHEGRIIFAPTKPGKQPDYVKMERLFDFGFVPSRMEAVEVIETAKKLELSLDDYMSTLNPEAIRKSGLTKCHFLYQDTGVSFFQNIKSFLSCL